MSNLVRFKKIVNKFFFLFTMIILSSCLFNSKKDIIAKYNKGQVYRYEVVDAYNLLPDEKKKELNTIDEYYKFVRRIALEEIILEKAFKEGLDKTENIVKKMENTKKSIAYDLLVEKNINNKIVIDDNDYKKYTKNFELYQIVKRIDAKDDSKNIKNKKFLEDLSGGIKNLNSFKEDAKKYSEDISSSEGGYLGFIRPGIMEDAIDNVLKKLPEKRVSDVIETSAGYHLIFIDKIEEIPIKELYKDRELYKSIYNEKFGRLEEEWYKDLLNDSLLVINNDKIREEKYDDEVVVKYKDKKITRKEFFDTVDKYRQSSFPEPTLDDMVSLAKNMGLNLILQDLSMNNSIIKSREFNKRFNRALDFLLINEYIQANIEKSRISEDDVKEFYENNKKNLFTFVLDNGTRYVQPMHEVIDFIKQKIDENFTQEARYNLYRKLVRESELEIDKDKLQKIKDEIERR